MSSTPQLAQSPGVAEQVVIVPINRSFSDGSDSTWPKDPKYGRPDDSVYREKLAKLWLQKTGAYENGRYCSFIIFFAVFWPRTQLVLPFV